MTKEQSNYLSQNWSKWINVATLFSVLGFAFTFGTWIANFEKDIQNLKEKQLEFDVHKKDQILHMPMERSIEVFVPRVELDSRFQNIEKILEKIDKKLDKL